MGPAKRRLRKLCDIEKERNNALRIQREITELKVNKGAEFGVASCSKSDDVLSTTSSGKSSGYDKTRSRVLLLEKEKPYQEAVDLACKIRKNQELSEDDPIVFGHVRDKVNTNHNPNMLAFEVALRSIGKTFEECLKEWVPNVEVGINGWVCVGGKYDIINGSKVWLDDPNDDGWVPGQCACLLHRGEDYQKNNQMIKYRYSIRNVNTNHVLTVGSTCISNFGSDFSNIAKISYSNSVKVVKQDKGAKKWLFI